MTTDGTDRGVARATIKVLFYPNISAGNDFLSNEEGLGMLCPSRILGLDAGSQCSVESLRSGPPESG